MPQQIGWSVEAKLLYEIKQLTKQLSGREYIAVYANFAAFPIPGVTGTLYVDQATGDIYVWNGTSYVLLSAGITALNGLIAAAQLFATGSAGTDFNISSVGTTHTFNIPTASAGARGLLSSADWTTFNNKQNALTFGNVSTSTSGVTIGNGTASTVGPNVTVNIATASAIQNGLLSSTDWSTFNNKQNAITLTTTGTSGAATLVGSTLNIPQYQSALTNPITGTGTTNYLSKFTGTTTLGNSQIFDNGTNVGIGTTSPVVALDVRGEVAIAYNANYGLRFYNDARNNWSSIGNTITGSTDSNLVFKSASGVMTYTGLGRLIIGSAADTSELLQVNGTMRTVNGAYFATSSGNVGIGTTSPSHKLSVIDGRILTQGILGSGAYNMLYVNTTNTSARNWAIGASDLVFGDFSIKQSNAKDVDPVTNGTVRMYFNTSGNVGINTTTDAGYQLDVAGSLRNTTGANFATTSGNVGIGTTSPALKLHVEGGMRLRNASGQILEYTNDILYNYGGSGNYWQYINGADYVLANRTATGALTFGANSTERMRITSSGAVGIGTTNPQGLFEVSGTNISYFTRGTKSILINPNVVGADTHAMIDVTSGMAITLGTGSTERMRITTGGNVLIGTTTDGGYKLRIEGGGSILQLVSTTAASEIRFQNSINTNGFISYYNTDLLFYANSGATSMVNFYGATNSIGVLSGTAPTSSVTDRFLLYSADITAGNAAPHFRTENGAVVKVYQETTGVGAATFVQGSVNAVYEDSTFDGYTLKQIVKALRNQGLLA